MALSERPTVVERMLLNSSEWTLRLLDEYPRMATRLRSDNPELAEKLAARDSRLANRLNGEASHGVVETPGTYR